jgi:hypothetical protein
MRQDPGRRPHRSDNNKPLEKLAQDLSQANTQLQQQNERLNKRIEKLQYDLSQADAQLQERKKELDLSQALYADLKNVSQVHDVDESKDLVGEFDELNMAVETVCNNITDWIGATAEQTLPDMTGQFHDFAPNSLLQSKTTVDLFVLNLLRFHVSRELHYALSQFHPGAPEAQKLIAECYELIRQTGEFLVLFVKLGLR